MLDQLLELLERDKRSGSSSKGGLRGKLGSLLSGDADNSHRSSERAHDRRSERDWDDDDDRHDDDRYDDDRRSRRSQRRESEPFDFGD